MADNMKVILFVLTIISVMMLVIPSEGIVFAQIIGEDDAQGNVDCESLLGEWTFLSIEAFLEECDDDQGNNDDDQGNNDDDQGNNDDDQGNND